MHKGKTKAASVPVRWLGALAALLSTVICLAFAGSAAADDGYKLHYSGLADRSSYTVRLVANSENVEALRLNVQAAIFDVSQSGGAKITLAPGTIPNREPVPGEILLVVENSCGPGVWACTELDIYGRRPADGRLYMQSSKIKVGSTVASLPMLSAQHIIEHELGHALGLAHYEGLYNGSYQVMRGTGDLSTFHYLAGDKNGLAYLAQPPVDLPHVASVDTYAKQIQGCCAGEGPSQSGHAVAAGTSPSAIMVNHVPHIFFVDSGNGNRITDWTWTEDGGYQLKSFGGHQVAAGTSPVAAVVNGRPQVFFVDAANGNTISVWWWTGTEWQQAAFGGHAVAAGTKPTVTVLENGDPRVYFVDANNGNTITEWGWSSSSGWKQNPLGGHQVAAGTSPSALVLNGKPNVFFSDAANKNTISVWWWTGTEWQQALFGGHAVAAGSSPSAATLLGTAQVFFSDAANSNGLTVWWWTGTEWQQTPFSTHAVTTGSSPSATMSNGTAHVYFSDAGNSNKVTDFNWSTTLGWNQKLMNEPPLVAGSSPSGF